MRYMGKGILIVYCETFFTQCDNNIINIVSSFIKIVDKVVIIGAGINREAFGEVADRIVFEQGNNQGLLKECSSYWLSRKEEARGYDNVYMLSSSLAGPIFDIQDMIKAMTDYDMWTMNSSNSRLFCVSGNKAVVASTYEELAMGKCICYSDTNLMLEPYTAISRDKVPFVDMYAYVQEPDEVLRYSAGEDIANSLEYLKDKTQYDTGIIWDNILRDGHMSDIVYNLKLNYVLSKDKSNEIPDVKIALIMHIYYSDLAEKCFEYAKSMPEISDVYITTDTKEKCDDFKKIFQTGNFNKVETIIIENRGRDVSALLTGAKHIVNEYDYVLFVHDKKVAHMDAVIKGESFAYKCFDNLLASKDYVKNIINTFEENERLGLLCPPPPNHADYFPTLGYFDWGMNYENTLNLKNKLGMKVKIDWRKEPISPLGTMFWFRPKALKFLFDVDWEYEDFPTEPNGIDGTLLHAIERLYSYVVQESGYYPAWIMNDRFAGMEMNNIYYMLKKINKHVFNVYGAATFNDLCDNIENGMFQSNVIRSISTKRFIRSKLSGIYHRIIRK